MSTPPPAQCAPLEHTFTRYGETKPYPGARQWIYFRTVSECTRCGRKSVSGWGRGLASSHRKGVAS